MNPGSTTQTSTEDKKSDPWAPAQPALQNLLGRATSLLDANTGAGVYQGDRTAGLGATTQAGLGLMRDGARAGAPVAASGNGFVNGLLKGGGTTVATRTATAGLAGIDTAIDTSGVATAARGLSNRNGVAARTGASLARGDYETDTGRLTGLADRLASGTTQTQRSLQDAADGKFLGDANPYLDDMIARSSNEAASAVGQRFAASGRYGSGRFAGATSDAVAGIGTKLRYDDYNAERARQVEAATAIDSAGNARAGLAGNLFSTVAGINQGNASTAATGAGIVQGTLRDAMSGQQALAGVRSDNANRELAQAGVLLQGAQSDRQAGLAGIAAIPGIQSALTQPGRTIAGIGGVYDDARQRELDANREQFAEGQTAPWKPLGLAAGIVNPIAGLGGTSSGTTETRVPQPSFFQQLLGFGLVGADVGSKFLGKI